MRIELNFATVIRNVAVLANVAGNVVESIVAAFQPLHQPEFGSDTHCGQETMLRRLMRSGMFLTGISSSPECYPALNLAYVDSPRGEITRRWRPAYLLSKRDVTLLTSTGGRRG